MADLPNKTKAVLDFVINFQDKNGFSPSIPEIVSATEIKSFRGVALHLEKLQKLGYINRDKNSRRAIKILVRPADVMEERKIKVPVIGEIKAGYNAFAEQNIESHKEIPISLARGRSDVFILRVRGDSMLKAGINPGDFVIVSPQATAENGDIVVALDPDDDTVTLKRFRRHSGYIMLLPESDNQEYKPKIGKQFVIQGKVIDKLPN